MAARSCRCRLLSPNRRSARVSAPTATGVFGAYTNNDTWFAGLGHSRTFKEDKWRLVAGAGVAKVNSTYYFADVPFKFSLDGTVGLVKLKRRMANSNMFLGLSTSYIDAETTFFEDLPVPELGIDFKDVGAALSVIYDSRDDTMMPAKNVWVGIDLARGPEEDAFYIQLAHPW